MTIAPVGLTTSHDVARIHRNHGEWTFKEEPWGLLFTIWYVTPRETRNAWHIFGMAFSMTWVLLLSESSKIANSLFKNSPKSSVQLSMYFQCQELASKTTVFLSYFVPFTYVIPSLFMYLTFFYSCQLPPTPPAPSPTLSPKKMGPRWTASNSVWLQASK